MIGSLRTVFLVAAIYLLASATAVPAECAWILWEESAFALDGKSWTEWRPEGFQSHEHCRAAVRRMADAVKGKPGWKVTGNLLEATGDGIARLTRLSCLPDTVDPRGPKGR